MSPGRRRTAAIRAAVRQAEADAREATAERLRALVVHGPITPGPPGPDRPLVTLAPITATAVGIEPGDAAPPGPALAVTTSTVSGRSAPGAPGRRPAERARVDALRRLVRAAEAAGAAGLVALTWDERVAEHPAAGRRTRTRIEVTFTAVPVHAPRPATDPPFLTHLMLEEVEELLRTGGAPRTVLLVEAVGRRALRDAAPGLPGRDPADVALSVVTAAARTELDNARRAADAGLLRPGPLRTEVLAEAGGPGGPAVGLRVQARLLASIGTAPPAPAGPTTAGPTTVLSLTGGAR